MGLSDDGFTTEKALSIHRIDSRSDACGNHTNARRKGGLPNQGGNSIDELRINRQSVTQLLVLLRNKP